MAFFEYQNAIVMAFFEYCCLRLIHCQTSLTCLVNSSRHCPVRDISSVNEMILAPTSLHTATAATVRID